VAESASGLFKFVSGKRMILRAAVESFNFVTGEPPSSFDLIEKTALQVCDGKAPRRQLEVFRSGHSD
jgi:hypothetical protein